LSYVHENEFIKLTMGCPPQLDHEKYYEDNVLYCILLQVAFQLEKTLDPHDKAFHPTSKD